VLVVGLILGRKALLFNVLTLSLAETPTARRYLRGETVAAYLEVLQRLVRQGRRGGADTPGDDAQAAAADEYPGLSYAVEEALTLRCPACSTCLDPSPDG